MSIHPASADKVDLQTASDLYQQAAQALLLAYQRNKEATRHHGRGAFRAALHHARLSCEHADAAQAHLAQALALSTVLAQGQHGQVLPSSDGPGHVH